MVLSVITAVAAISAFFVWIAEADEVEEKYQHTGHVSDVDLRTYVVISPTLMLRLNYVGQRIKLTLKNYEFCTIYYLNHWQSVTVVIVLISCIGNLIYLKFVNYIN